MALRFLQDKWFWLALAAGPCVWVALWWFFSVPITIGGAMTWTVLLSLIVIYPVLEEIVFRGALQGWLLGLQPFKQRLTGISLANLLTSVLFTGLHFFNHSPLWAALVFVPSLVFGWARDRFDSIAPAIALHVFYNAGFLLLFG